MEGVIGEMGTAVAVKAIGSEFAHAWFGFGEEKLETALFFGGEGGLAFHGSVELGVEGEAGEEEVFEGKPDVV